MGEISAETGIVCWSSPEWVCPCFPQTQEDQRCMEMKKLVHLLLKHLDTVTEADTTALSQSLHVGHILVTMQGSDGLWPDVFNMCTGDQISSVRSSAPVKLLVKMKKMLGTTEFQHSLQLANAGMAVQVVE